MIHGAMVLSLPIADRQVAYDFYRHALDLEAVGEPGDDGLPEPLQFVVNDGLRLLLPPSDGFRFTIGDEGVAARGSHECVLVIPATSDAETDKLIAQAVSSGASIVTTPDRQPWGYAGSFADPDGHIWMVRTSDEA